jgi:hypothetical protein
MKRKSIFDYYAFGFNYGILKRDGVSGVKKAVALSLIEEFLETAGGLELTVTLEVAGPLQDLIPEIKALPGDDVPADMAQRVSDQLDRIDPTLDAELSLRFAFVMTKKRYPLDSLTFEPGALLAENVFQRLSDPAKRDVALACVQIALSQPTGAVFHLMRALEQQVRVLYRAFKKTNRLKVEMWGPMTSELRAKKAPRPSTKLLDHLDTIRVNFRNPTQHPDAFYTLDEAQDLLSQTLAALNMIDAALPKRN